ncbi:MAG: hypothetical protein ABI560_19520, partial [Myxococcales bacterium]
MASLVLAGAVACTAENGKGVLTGSLHVPACSFDQKGNPVPLDAREWPDPFTKHWNFFVGEPFDSITPRIPASQINIRMQGSSARWEFADAITFWVQDSYEVARCVRHHTNTDGSGDWDPRYCDGDSASLGPGGEGRILIGTEIEKVSSHFLLPNSCAAGAIYADALGDCSGGECPLTLCPGHGSWIRFSHFGSIDRNEAPPRDFKVNNDEIIEASAFHVEICDSSTVEAQQEKVLPVPFPAVTGVL